MNRAFVALLCASALVAAACHRQPFASDADNIRAEAHLLDTLGREVGTVRLTETTGMRGVTVAVEIEGGVTPDSTAFTSIPLGTATRRINLPLQARTSTQRGKKHGLFSPDGPHAGDFEQITVDDFRNSSFTAQDARITLSAGPNSLLDADGSSIVIHALPDDQRTDPSGNSGARVACGVIIKR